MRVSSRLSRQSVRAGDTLGRQALPAGEPIHGLASFFAAKSDFIGEISWAGGIVGFAIIAPNAGAERTS